MFSSPHGDFSFSINNRFWLYRMGGTSFRPLTGISLFLWTLHGGSVSANICFRPLTGISLFLWHLQDSGFFSIRFRPLTGISLFLSCARIAWEIQPRGFSSPHGDFSFSIFYPAFATRLWWFQIVFVPSRGFLFFYDMKNNGAVFTICFRPLTGISLFLSYLIFPL